MPKRSAASTTVNSPKRSVAETSVAVGETDTETVSTIPPASTKIETKPNVTSPVHTPDASSPSSSPPSPASCIRPVLPPVKTSPTNRDKFMAGLYVQTVGCCLDACTAGPNVRLTFKGTVVVLYPLNINPDRRYVVFMDEDGFTGLTIWSPNLKKIATSSIGKLCEITRVSMSSHQGKRLLNLSKESEVSRNEYHKCFYS
jgi:hypothetical protein